MEQEFTFKVLNVTRERRFKGKTVIQAECVEDNMLLDITVDNAHSQDKVLLRTLLLGEHSRLVALQEKHKNDVQEGTVL